MDINKIIELLKTLKIKAELNANTIYYDDEIRPVGDRLKSEGYASAYSFCIKLLEDYVYENNL